MFCDRTVYFGLQYKFAYGHLRFIIRRSFLCRYTFYRKIKLSGVRRRAGVGCDPSLWQDCYVTGRQYRG